MCRTLLSSIILLISAETLHAQTPEKPVDSRDGIIITGAYARTRQDVLQATSVIEAADLQRQLRPTIGDTLLGQPGVSATSFGPGASRPVIRGQQGERVRVLVDGIGSIDAASTSVDHAVAGDTLTAERIEVLRGPATLLFGSSGIGGVVNIIDSRIPAERPESTATGRVQASYGSAAKEGAVASTLNLQVTPGLLLHLDGSYRDTGDLHIGGPAISQRLADQLGVDRSARSGRRLGNSDLESRSFSGGATAYSADGAAFLGAVIGRYLTNYGSPVEESVRIDLMQTRVDAKAGMRFESGPFEQARLRFGWADYSHVELDDGTVGTRFLNTGWETRLELTQRAKGAWQGAVGLHYARRDFSAIGEERFVPPNLTQQFGLFALQEVTSGRFRFEMAGRYEHSSARSDEIGIRRSFDSVNASFGGAYEPADDVRVGMMITRAVRAPSAEELFAFGPHAATGVFEIGDAALKPERSWNAEINLHAHTGRLTVHGAVYHSWFSNFIHESFTVELEDDLPVQRYVQADARYFGAELEADFTLIDAGNRKMSMNLLADVVRATNRATGSGLPRIPPFRLRGGLSFESEEFDIRGDVEWIAAQKRIASFELPTDSFVTAGVSATWWPWRKDRNRSVIFDVSNIFDAEVRRHASVTKDRVPAAGRDVRLTFNWAF